MKDHSQKDLILIVSGYSSGKYLAPIFRGKGYSCIHITSEAEFQIERLHNYYDPHDI